MRNYVECHFCGNKIGWLNEWKRVSEWQPPTDTKLLLRYADGYEGTGYYYAEGPPETQPVGWLNIPTWED